MSNLGFNLPGSQQSNSIHRFNITKRAGLGYILIIAAGILISAFSSCDQYKPILSYLKHGPDSLYIAFYSDSMDFTTVFFIDTFYRQSRDHFSLPPSEMEAQFWAGGTPNKPDFNRKNYYARVIGICSNDIFYSGPVHYRVNREAKLDELQNLNNERHKTVTLETPKGLIDVPIDSLK